VAASRPIVGIPACVKPIGNHDFHVVGRKYVDALVTAAGCTPLLLPALGDRQDVAKLLSMLDGLLLTGSASNVEPARYGQHPHSPQMLMDTERDATNFPLITAALEAGLPLFGICRGLQELNVALGGTLHQQVQSVAGRFDHRAAEEQPLDLQYGVAHAVVLTVGGQLQALFGGADEIHVNSIHGQGIAKLAHGLAVEATAPDGQIEAIRVENARHFALAVQWHPEWRVMDNPDSRRLFAAFGEACGAVRG